MKIYVGNLPFSVDDEKLREIFAKFGDVEEATVIKDKYSGRSKGFGFVTFSDDASAKKAIEELNEKEVEGRSLKVNEARPMEDRPPRRDFGDRGRGGGGRSFGGGHSGGGHRSRF
ncbi:MAG: RNA-binding protein [Candidatus Pacearchaeota archaeon]|nr:RNA-binding protein [Nanoarchaeota archaeon]MDZ4226639.1 RNA-binding protein [Candidatus Pacearchaeota archaeon]